MCAEGKSKDFTQRAQRKSGEKSEKDDDVYRRDAEGAEKGNGESAMRAVAGSVALRLNPHPSHETMAGRMGHP